MVKVFVDSSFLLDAAKFRIDWPSELVRLFGVVEIVVFDGVVKELKGLSIGKSKKAQDARLALLVLERKKVVQKRSWGEVDDVLVQQAKPGDVVATEDGEVKRRLKTKGINSVIIRQKKFLDQE